METSTPLAHRQPAQLLDDSPIGDKHYSLESQEEHQITNNSEQDTGTNGAKGLASKTGVSGDIDLIELTPPKVESDLVKVARKSVGLKEHYDSHESYQKRLLLKEPLREQDSGMGVLSIVLLDTLWDENVKFKRYIDDSKSFEVEDIVLDG